MKISWKRIATISVRAFYTCLFLLLAYQGLCACGTAGTKLSTLLVEDLVPVPPNLAAVQAKAERGDKEAQILLGGVYSQNSWMVKPDGTDALKWYNKAASQGYAKAQNSLGIYYFNGYDTIKGSFDIEKISDQRNYGVAYFWFSLASKQEATEAEKLDYRRKRDLAAEHLTPEVKAVADKLVKEWKPGSHRWLILMPTGLNQKNIRQNAQELTKTPPAQTLDPKQ